MSSGGGLWDTANELYAPFNTQSRENPRFQHVFPSGAKVEFGHLQKETSTKSWDGAQLAMIGLLAAASGSRGMAGGQAIDLAAVGKALERSELEFMHIHKTGAIIRAAKPPPATAATASGTIQNR